MASSGGASGVKNRGLAERQGEAGRIFKCKKERLLTLSLVRIILAAMCRSGWEG